jgi:hypothetical protein
MKVELGGDLAVGGGAASRRGELPVSRAIA